MHISNLNAYVQERVPQSLLSLFQTQECPNPDVQVERPRKRQKVNHSRASTSIFPIDHGGQKYIALAQVDIDLICTSNDAGQPHLLPAQPDDTAWFPVLLKKFEEVRSSKFQITVTTLHHEKIIDLPVISTPSIQILEVLQRAIRLGSSTKSGNAEVNFAIAVVPQTSHQSPPDVFRLRTRILWKNSNTLTNIKTDEDDNLLATYAPQEELKSRESWSPQDFYGSVHVPDGTTTPEKGIQDGRLTCELYPFQRRALRWLLQREGVDYSGNRLIVYNDEHDSHPNDGLPHGFYPATDADGKNCFVSQLLGIVTTDRRLLQKAGANLRGGILAEEMGLGKTVELIALICLHTQSTPLNHERIMANQARRSPATLIITPSSISQQWKDELQALAPTLRVLFYNGVRKEANGLSDTELLTQLQEQDVVLTTYNVLASEVHYTGTTPDRDLRYGKKYQRRQSPLVKLLWWRVVLDEAQMIENSVSNPAKVAQIIPRENAWAVSGTPLRKDAKDLLGLLVFLRLEPYCHSSPLWDRLVSRYRITFQQIFGNIALRHTKEQIREDIQLPPQQRVVITVPFTPVEEQHYIQIFQQMCDDCGLDVDGVPLSESWDPESASVIEKMRNYLVRLRQTCLHPEVGGRNRRALGHGDGPLRTVEEVLEVMIDQNETVIRTEERALLLSKARRGQVLEHAGKSQEALDIWLQALAESQAIVKDCRQQLRTYLERTELIKTGGEDSEELIAGSAADSRSGPYRQRLRAALEVEHICTFFTANAYYQIKTDETHTQADSEQFRKLEKAEEEAYERSKTLRKEMLSETHAKAESFMATIKARAQGESYTEVPELKIPNSGGGIESRRILERLEDLCSALDHQANQLDEFREKTIQLLLQPLVDEEDTDLQGDEYEASTKQQDDLYVYVEVLRAMVADRHDVLTGQSNMLVEHEMRFAQRQAMEGAGHSPELFKSLMTIRNNLKPSQHLGSMRGIIAELRALKAILRVQGEKASSRAVVEIAMVDRTLEALHRDATEQGRAVTGLEREIELFKDAMNARLGFYRQLQQISDTVAPYEEDLNEEARDRALSTMKGNESKLEARIATLKAKGRYLDNLRDESTAHETQRMCIICQQPFEVGALTSCGHSYCKECLRLWWSAHRSCPTCKKHLSRNDFHQITYKPQELTVQEEAQTKGSEVSMNTSPISIYSGISNAVLSQIKNVEVEGSFGTKIDTLARHILFLREHDPGAKSVVFSQFRDFLDVLGRAFAQFKIGFTGIDSKGGVEKFKSDPHIECFFLHAKAHSSGLNLVNATHVFLCEPLINTAIELQAIARVHRIGQHQGTTVWMYLVEDTVEKCIYDISVSRRMSHMGREGRAAAATGKGKSQNAELNENAIEAANSQELEQAPLSKLLTKGRGGGEMVDKDDLWKCLFQKENGRGARKHLLPHAERAVAEREVVRHLGASAAEGRREVIQAE
ncbi:MAG: SNF2 family helicase [Lasallia pustulata]|uniref:SNF2 family helicase n=1 Tax=Lasallia pustulata TaxID=136370 RepID=A0A5M8Q4A6_9LECA|nr:MAG: SNF2 family helicase [Lasallia pustulata]